MDLTYLVRLADLPAASHDSWALRYEAEQGFLPQTSCPPASSWIFQGQNSRDSQAAIMPFSSTAVDKPEALSALGSPRDGVQQREAIKLFIEKTKTSLAKSQFQIASRALEAAEPTECWNQVGEKKFRSGLETDNNENIYTTGIDKDRIVLSTQKFGGWNGCTQNYRDRNRINCR